MRQISKPAPDKRTIRRCDHQGGPLIEGNGPTYASMCHLARDHDGPHQCVTMMGTNDERWWEWD